MSSSSRPYLARALYEWLLDNELTPYMVVDAEIYGVIVPRQFVQNGQIVLNAAPGAVRDLVMENAMIAFSARFGGQPMRIEIPIEALVALYARENGVGMVFGHEPVIPEGEEDEGDDKASSSAGPSLRSVEASEESASDAGSEDGAGGDDDKASRPSSKRPSLRVIK
ncbi:ClpXP protease specificity-enhancing factor [Larsenimonas rhizosphaerae]|uniref:ClpXP protease specificity-enhancing factor n=1 Tax=Larsenimonas rhizosphaerae TaxID=2944682 RepID=UPI0020337F03|nr:ClpXP protease specificity-enhancing factor [Larsenimonas rhizosphaerae]MCM2131058.1 ClpXP protease specificity-enhancing factor [Larsenimonas rhizosphaerae]